MQKYQKQYPNRILYLEHKKNLGLGYSYREAIKYAEKQAFTWFPSDGENEPIYLVKYLFLLNHLDVIVPFAVNKGVRSLFRRILSTIYLIIINLSFGYSFNYTNGNIIFRLEYLKKINLSANSFLFQSEALIKTIKENKNIMFAEVPIWLGLRKDGKAKAISWKNLFGVIRDFIKLFFYIHITMRLRERKLQK